MTGEVAELSGASAVSLARYDDDRLTVVAQRGAAYVRVGERFPLRDTNVKATVMRTGRSARRVDAAEASRDIGDIARRAGVESVVAAPVVAPAPDVPAPDAPAALWTAEAPYRLTGRFWDVSTEKTLIREAGQGVIHALSPHTFLTEGT